MACRQLRRGLLIIYCTYLQQPNQRDILAGSICVGRRLQHAERHGKNKSRNYRFFYESNPIVIENTQLAKKRTQSNPFNIRLFRELWISCSCALRHPRSVKVVASFPRGRESNGVPSVGVSGIAVIPAEAGIQRGPKRRCKRHCRHSRGGGNPVLDPRLRGSDGEWVPRRDSTFGAGERLMLCRRVADEKPGFSPASAAILECGARGTNKITHHHFLTPKRTECS